MRDIAPDFQMLQNLRPLFFIFVGKYCSEPVPRTTFYLVETAPDPLFFIFLEKIFCPGLPLTWSEASSPS